MVISSLVIETMPDRLDQVAAALAAVPGVEVHETLRAVPGKNGSSVGKVVITIERDTVDESQPTANGFVGIDGIIGIDLIYANFEDDPTSLAQRAKNRARAATGKADPTVEPDPDAVDPDPDAVEKPLDDGRRS